MAYKVAGPMAGCGKTWNLPVERGLKKEISSAFECRRTGDIQ